MPDASKRRQQVRPRAAAKLPGAVSWFKGLMTMCLVLVFGFYLTCAGFLVLLRWFNPPTTSVQIERRIQALVHRQPYYKQYRPVPLSSISLGLQHAVVAGEDARFYKHRGFDWIEVQKVLDKASGQIGWPRGASTITQQLVKNLFLTTSRSFVRKGVEASLVPIAEFLLTKNRILELYLNVIEWGPGIYGAEAAANYYYKEHASSVTREQASRLAAVIPAPLYRNPAQMGRHSADIRERMSEMNW